jgi:type IV pilus assembly protein PilA
MSRLNGPVATLTLALALTALVAGCGGDSKAKSSAPNTQQQAKDDASAKSSARTLVTLVETCYVDQMSYASCKLGADGKVGGEPSRLAPGTGPGQVTSTGTDTGYVVTATSKSGNKFVIAKDASGEVARTCTTKGQGGCPASGGW